MLLLDESKAVTLKIVLIEKNSTDSMENAKNVDF